MDQASHTSGLRIPLTLAPEHPCSYFPDRVAQVQAFAANEVDPEIYHYLMDRHFRRSGNVFYKPVCPGCQACIPIRVPVEGFRPSKSQRRNWRANEDLLITEASPRPTEEKYDLFQRYQSEWHDGKMDHGFDEFRTFLYESPVRTVEFEYRQPDGKLLGVGICDLSGSALSSVYFYFDPDYRQRGLGTFGALYEIERARAGDIAHYYLGYWITGCAAMEYKARFQPYEWLSPDGKWMPQGS